MILVLIIVFVAVPVAVAHFFNRRFKRAKLRRLGRDDVFPANNVRPTIPFSSPEAVGRWTSGFLIATLILMVVAVYTGTLQVGLVSRMAGGSGYTMEEVIRSVSRQGLISLLQGLFYLGTGVSFLIWFHRMYKNLPGLGQTGLAFTPGWAVGFFFVPFLNFVRPFQAMREIWHGSDPGPFKLAVTLDGPGIHSQPGTPHLVHFWWALFHISNFVVAVADQGYFRALKTQPFPELRTVSVLMIVADTFVLASALVTLRLVTRLTRWQAERAEMIRQRGGPVAETPMEGAGKKPLKRRLLWAGATLIAAVMILYGVSEDRKFTRTSEGPYFAIGATKAEVLRVQGQPDIDSGLYWWYGGSVVTFDLDGKVKDYSDNSKNLKVKSR